MALTTVSLQHVMMKVIHCLLSFTFLLSTVGFVECLFIPEELPTLLSFLYTNIPPIFKGTDSRLGVGFRVGPNADFQVQLELGPQTRTKALGPDAEQEGTSKKRHAPKLEFDTIRQDRSPFVMKTPPYTPGGWLQSWKSSLGTEYKPEEEEEKPGKQLVMDYDTVRHLQQLYKEIPASDDVQN